MGERSSIEWTDHTFNPWIGCARVSPGCLHCYAETRDRRFGDGLWGKTAPRRVTSDANWRKPHAWNRAAEAAGRRDRVFCASLADVFEDRPDLVEARARLWQLIADTPHLDWLLLTKRPENLARMVPWLAEYPGLIEGPHAEWWSPWPNVWLGTSVEDQQRADERVWQLARIPAAVRFLSCEPLLGPVDLTRVEGGGPYLIDARDHVDWVIVGGESGPDHRLMDAGWAASLRDQCVQAEVAFFFKQWGGDRPKANGRELDGRTWDEMPVVHRG